MSEETRRILTNREVIAVDQDALGIQGFRHRGGGDLEVWVRPLAGGDWAVVFLNRGITPLPLRFDWRAERIEDTMSQRRVDAVHTRYRLRDLWADGERGDTASPLSATLPPHDVLMVRLLAPSG
jgi:alpha-galactosidase